MAINEAQLCAACLYRAREEIHKWGAISMAMNEAQLNTADFHKEWEERKRREDI